ncbi:tyrosine-type recombinase/integrase [Corticimicrobacter populi]|uniref:Integrase n=1 Tax=Corticimicrobacter populi TaxID=2175229 RepID=A0A2V1K158_9BURK|nr:integrase arm-type DNA-binding domain-containing protein [Corticimicrobacter populi]PWF25004.1 integrase [Corticimicrobacter populi]
MAKKIPPLTDSQCRSAKYGNSGNKLFDGGGLYLEVLKSGHKRWRLKYRRPLNKKENALTIGPYPAVTLSMARAKREQAKAHLAAGVDPDTIEDTDGKQVGQKFRDIAEEWLKLRRPGWSPGYHQRISNALNANAYPDLGRRAIAQISGKAVLDVVKKVESRGALEMASRVLESIGMVFRYAVGIGMTTNDVTQGLAQFLQPRPPVEHFPHVGISNLPDLLTRIAQYHGRPETKAALKLMIHTFPRTNELRWAEWGEIDFEASEWHIPAQRMKGSVIQKATAGAHIVPLSKQCLLLLQDLHKLTGRHQFLFPGMRSPRVPMSSETINKALKIMGFEGEQTGHGFRGLASTIMNEYSGIRADVIERQLAHKDRNKIRRAYNHAQYMDERRELMQWWSDYLDAQREMPGE